MPGTTVQLQGYLCSPTFIVTRSVGFEPDFASVFIDRARLTKKSANLLLQMSPVPGWPHLEEVPATATLPTPEEGKGLYLMGDLVLKEVELTEQGLGHGITFKHMLLSERSLEGVAGTSDGSGVVKVELTDVRRLWADRGTVHTWINVPYRYLPEEAGPPRTQSYPPLVPGTTDGDAPWTVRRAIEVKILPFLPGVSATLKKIPEDVGNKVCPTHKWEYRLAKDCLSELLEEVGLVLALNPDCSLSLWKRGDGLLEDEDGVVLLSNDPRLSSVVPLLSHRYIADRVVIVGRPIVEEFEEELVAVGEQRDGRLVPIAQFMRDLNADPRVVLLTEQDKKVAFGSFGEEDLRLIERCAFKWYALPGAVFGADAEARSRMPIEDLPITANGGFRKAARVRAESHQVVNAVALAAAASFRKARREADPGAASSDPDGKPNQPRVSFSTETAADKLLKDMQASETVAMQAIYNLPMSDQGGEYTIDRERGLVKFATPRLKVSAQYVSAHVATPIPAKVVLRYGSSRKAKLNEPLSLADRYSSAWEIEGDPLVEREGGLRESGSGVTDEFGKFVIKRAEVSDVFLRSAKVIETDFQQLTRLDGTGNVGECDQLARAIAESVLLIRRGVGGGIYEFHRPMPIVNTGRVLSIQWTNGDEGPKTTAYDSQYAPLDHQVVGKQLDARRRSQDKRMTGFGSALRAPFLQEGDR